jgi:hypothetical protein
LTYQRGGDLGLLAFRTRWQFFVIDDGIRYRLQFREIDRLIEFAFRGRRLWSEPKAQRARTVIR